VKRKKEITFALAVGEQFQSVPREEGKLTVGNSWFRGGWSEKRRHDLKIK